MSMKFLSRQDLINMTGNVMTSAPHSANEWDAAYSMLALHAKRFWELEECLEQAIAEKYGKSELIEVIHRATTIYDQDREPLEEHKLSAKVDAVLDKVFAFDDDWDLDQE